MYYLSVMMRYNEITDAAGGPFVKMAYAAKYAVHLRRNIMKKITALLLALVLCVGLLCACTPSEEPPVSTNSPSTPTNTPEDPGNSEPVMEDPAEITVILWANGAPPTNEALALVNEKINEITVPEINVIVDLQIWDVGTYIGTAATAVGAGDDIDLMCTFPAAAPHFSNMSAQNMLLPLNDLLEEYAPGILDLIPEAWWAATSLNGEILGVPIYANKAVNYGVTVVKEWFDELGLKVEDIKTMDDLHAMLKAFQAKHPDKIAFSGDNLTLDFTYPGFDFINGSYFDQLGDASGVAAIVPFKADGTTDYKVVSRYETEGFNTMRKTLQQWYSEGLIDKDTFSYNGNGFPMTVNADVFAGMSVATPTQKANRGTAFLREGMEIELMSGTVSTAAVTQFTWALPTSCDEEAAAVKFMNMLYTNADIYNLICFGVEGVHYELDANGQMVMPEGMSPESSPYYPNCFNFVGNTILTNTWAGTDPELPQKEDAAIKNSVASPLLGFTFDTSAVADQYARIGTIAHDEYGPFIFTGAASDAQYEEFIGKLYENGLQDVIDEAQRQIDAWVAANK